MINIIICFPFVLHFACFPWLLSQNLGIGEVTIAVDVNTTNQQLLKIVFSYI